MKLLKRSLILLCGVSASALVLAINAGADSFTIVNGQTVTTTQTLDTTGNVGTVEEGGVIDVLTGNGIEGTANGVTVNNAGSVTGGDAGIYTEGTGNKITNSGSATGFEGISTSGDDITITNSGTATGLPGSYSNGIYTGGNNNKITNSGTATGVYNGIFAEFAEGNGNTITNSGTATGGNVGILTFDNNNTITNSGSTTGGQYGVYAKGNGNTITNSGTATGGDAGIYTEGYDNTITNSGTIIGGTDSVFLNGTNNTLTLLRGSNIQGNLALGGASNKLIFGKGFADAAFAFTGTPTIDTGSNRSVVSDGVVYIVSEPGYFAAQQDLVNDLTRVVTDTVEGRLAAARLSGGGGMSVSMNGTTIAAAADVSVAPSNGFWMSGIGSYRDQQGSGSQYDFTTTLGGLMGGLDGMIAENTRFGIFGGFATGGMDAGNEPQDLDSDSFFGGAYVGQDWGNSFADLSVTAGWSNFDTTRRVLNNMVAGGVEQVSGENGGFLFSPSLKVGTNIETGGGTFTPSIRVRYAGLYLDSYEEDGSAADLNVDSRNINIFDARGELAYTLTHTAMAGGSLYQTVRVGIDGTISDADSVEATLAGQALNFDVANDNLVRGYVGYDAVLAISDGASLNASAEVGYDSTDALTLQANGGLTFTF